MLSRTPLWLPPPTLWSSEGWISRFVLRCFLFLCPLSIQSLSVKGWKDYFSNLFLFMPLFSSIRVEKIISRLLEGSTPSNWKMLKRLKIPPSLFPDNAIIFNFAKIIRHALQITQVLIIIFLYKGNCVNAMKLKQSKIWSTHPPLQPIWCNCTDQPYHRGNLIIPCYTLNMFQPMLD